MRELVRFFATSSLYVSVSYLLDLVGIGFLERYVSIPLILYSVFGPRRKVLAFLTGLVSVFFALSATHTTWPVQEGWWMDALILGTLTGLSTFLLSFDEKKLVYVSPVFPSLFHVRTFHTVVINYLLTVLAIRYLGRREG